MRCCCFQPVAPGDAQPVETTDAGRPPGGLSCEGGCEVPPTLQAGKCVASAGTPCGCAVVVTCDGWCERDGGDLAPCPGYCTTDAGLNAPAIPCAAGCLWLDDPCLPPGDCCLGLACGLTCCLPFGAPCTNDPVAGTNHCCSDYCDPTQYCMSHF